MSSYAEQSKIEGQQQGLQQRVKTEADLELRYEFRAARGKGRQEEGAALLKKAAGQDAQAEQGAGLL
ncbi:MAG: hypothetical protein Q4D91_01585 [Lautropia sp.]|nr:hypothetical protein [Lautropia sp.]